MRYLAHFRRDPDGALHVQTVEEHCRNTAKFAAEDLAGVGLEKAGYLAGLLHDMGKMTGRFREYLEDGMSETPSMRRGSVVHTYQAVRFFLTHFHISNGRNDSHRVTSEILAYAAGAHHGLFDCLDEDALNGFQRRMDAEFCQYDEAQQAFYQQFESFEKVAGRFDSADEQLQPFYDWIKGIRCGDRHKDKEGVYFYCGMMARLLLSAVIDGDRRDTASFESDEPPFRTKEFSWQTLLERTERKIALFPQETAISKARAEISRRCREAAERPCGVYRLSVPTGSGKTLASLRFALAHANKHGSRRIIFTAPLLGIIDQNAKDLRDAIGDDELVLEHHSDLVQEKRGEEEREKLDRRELMTENWDAPVIITTLVQFLNTLYDGRTSCIRRFWALCNSVIVIDEVQSVPVRMLSLFNMAVNFLVHVCRATVVLCSATQPCLEAAQRPICEKAEELVPYDPELWAPFARTRLIDGGKYMLKELLPFALRILEKTDSLLIVCNKKAEARELYHGLLQSGLRCYHLSASMCWAHRQDVLNDLRKSLNECVEGGPKVVCVSTQVIEAGIDISFASVIRLTAGMDNIVQAAGRCNRNGESKELAPVYLVLCEDEDLRHLGDIAKAKAATLQLLHNYKTDPERFGCDLCSDASIALYYRNLYANMKGKEQDLLCGERITVFDLLAQNRGYTQNSRNDQTSDGYFLHQAFREAGEKFEVFDGDTVSVAIPYGKGAELIASLGARDIAYDLKEQRELLQKLKPYTVSLYRWEREALTGRGALFEYWGGAVLALAPEFYDDGTGVVTEPLNCGLWEE